MLHIIREERIIKKIFICNFMLQELKFKFVTSFNFIELPSSLRGVQPTGLSSSLGGGVADASSAAAALAVPGPLALGGVSANWLGQFLVILHDVRSSCPWY